MIVTVLVGARYGQREKVFDAVIDKVEVKTLAELSPREIEHDNPEIRRLDEFTEWLGQALQPRRLRGEHGHRDPLLPDRGDDVLMALSWSDAKRLVRLNGLATELLMSARATTESDVSAGIDRQLVAVATEVHAVLADSEPDTAGEFRRMILDNQADQLPPEVRAASMTGWLNAALASESLEQKVRQELRVEASRPRKQTLGFHIRSPVVRAEAATEARRGTPRRLTTAGDWRSHRWPLPARSAPRRGGDGRRVRGCPQSKEGAVVALKLLRRQLSGRRCVRRTLSARGARRAGGRRIVISCPYSTRVRWTGITFWRRPTFRAARWRGGSSTATGLEIDEAVRLAVEIGAGLDALHAGGLVHRDVKPSNILFDAGGAAVLTDFGLARGPAYTVLTEPGMVMGTIDYIAPELVRGEAATAASDIYALGCVVFECLHGFASVLEHEHVRDGDRTSSSRSLATRLPTGPTVRPSSGPRCSMHSTRSLHGARRPAMLSRCCCGLRHAERRGLTLPACLRATT